MKINTIHVLAHRGGSYRAPENTLAAFRQAISDGADGFECDVRLTLDGEPVVCHDENLRRLTGRNLLIRQTNWPEIQQLKVLGTDEQIPHLREVLDLVQRYSIQCFIEFKYYSEELITLVLSEVKSLAIEKYVTIMAFNSRGLVLQTVKRSTTSLRTNVITVNPISLIQSARQTHADIVSFGWGTKPWSFFLFKGICSIFDIKNAVARAQQEGIFVTAGVANSEREVELLMDYGVDGIWTDDVPLVRSSIRAYPDNPDLAH